MTVDLNSDADMPVTIRSANYSHTIVNVPDEKRIEADIVTRGWADPQNHASLTKGEPLAKGKFYEVQFELQPDDQIIPAGKRLALMIFSSDRDFKLWPPKGTKQSVDLGATSLELPVVGGAAAFERALAAVK